MVFFNKMIGFHPSLLRPKAVLSLLLLLAASRGGVSQCLSINNQNNPAFSICQGDSIVLNAAGGNGGYTWSPNNGLSATTGSSIAASPNSTTNYTLTSNCPGNPNATLNFTITVNQNPTVLVSANPSSTISCGGQVTLTASGAGNNPQNYTWSTGLNGNPLVVSPRTTTSYWVIGTNTNGCIDTSFITVTVNPVFSTSFNFSPAAAQCSGAPIQFSTPNLGIGYTYSWNFGDPLSGQNNTSTLINPSHSFNNAYGTGTQNYTVTLTVTNSVNCSFTVTQQVPVTQKPNAQLSAPTWTNCDGNPFLLTVTNSTAPLSGNTNYTIIWGDGTPNYTGGSLTSQTHVYPLGSYLLRFIVTGANGCIDTTEYLVRNITNPAIGIVSLGTTTGCAPNNTTFRFLISGFSSNDTSTIYVLDYGDGSPALTFNHPPPDTLFHTYLNTSCGQPGAPPNFPVNAYIVSIRAINSCDSTPGAVGNIRVYTPPDPDFTINPNPACVNSVVTFNNTTVNGYGLNCSTNGIYVWDFGDGTTQTVNTTAAVTHIYAASGTYTVTLTASNYCDTLSVSYPVCVVDPVLPAFTLLPKIGCIPHNVTTNNSSSSLLACAPAIYNWTVTYQPAFCGTAPAWSFTNGTSASSVNPSFQFTNAGIYFVTLSITNPCGTVSYTDTVTVKQPPQVTLNPVPNSCGPVTISPVANVINCGTSAITYAWTFSGGVPATSTSATPTVSFSSVGTHTIRVIASNECGPDTAIVSFSILPPPVASASASPGTICFGGSSSLIGSSVPPVNIYSWSPATGLSNASVSNPTATPATTTTYILTVTDAAGCTDTASVTVTVIPLPIVSVSATPVSFCLGDSSRLVASSNNNPYQAVSYVWSPTSGLSSGTGASVWAKPTLAGAISYTVTGTSSFGCTSSASVSLNVWALPSVNAGPDSTVCNQGIPVNLLGLPAGGTWSGPGVVNGQFTPTTPGVGTWSLIYSYTDANGCRNSDTARYTVVNPTPASAGSDDTLCLNSTPVALQGGPPNGSWSGNGVSQTGTFTPSSAGVFPLVYTFGSGSCLSRDTLLMTVLPLPALTISPNDTICIGDTTSLSVSSNNVPNQATSFNWSPFTGLNTSTGSNVTAFPVINTTYTVTGTSAFGCTASASVSVRVNALPTVDAGANQNFCDTNLVVQLNAATAGGGVWSGSNITPGGALNLGPLTPGTYTYTYTFTDQNGCVNRDSLLVTISSPTLAIAGPDDSLCVNAAPIPLNGQPGSGTWSGSTGIVNNNSFNPAASGPGLFTLVYTSGTGTCQSRDSLTILVYALPLVDAGNPQSFCIDGGIQQLNGSPAGGTWSGTGVSTTGSFDPQLAGIGSHYLFYTYSDGNNCSNVDSVLIAVNALPFVEAGNDTSFCLQPILAQLGSTSTPAGGVWSGTGVVNASGLFDPIVSGTGVFWVYYTVTSGAGCDAVDSLQVTVSSPNTIFAGNDTAVCINSGTFVLNPSPGGGTWSGSVVGSTGVVTPNNSGSFLLIYNFGTGTCLRTDSLILTVHPLPSINLAGNIQSICEDRPSVLLSALPAGGTWTGNGISGNSFDPGVAGPGLHWLVYTYTDANTCTNLDSISITVNALPLVFAGNDTSLCDLPLPVSFSGNFGNTGTWSGTPAVSPNGVFTPAGVGTYTLVYTYTDANGCSSSDTLLVTVVSPQTADAGPGDTVCVDAAPFTLQGFFPASGGTWSGPGITNPATGLFDPALAFQGQSLSTAFTLYYTYGQGNCYTIDSTRVTVHPLPVVSAGNDIDTCISVGVFTPGGGQPAGGTWSGPGVINAATGTLDPVQAGVGVHTVVYSYVSPLTGCINRDSLRFEVFPLPVPDFSIDTVLCINVAYNPQNNSVGGATWFWDFGNGITSNLQSPQITYTATGNYSILLVVTSAEGCVDSVRKNIQVVEPPSPSFTLAPNEGCGPLTVSFNNTSVSFSPSYTWNFGNGQTSTDEDPAPVTYIASLYNDTTYYITLSAGNLCGSVNAVDSVLVHPSPTSYFGVNVNSGCSPLTIDFSNNSYGLPTSYFWDFGDGSTSTDSLPPPHVFTTDSTISTYIITLIAYNACGSDTLRDTIIVLPNTVRAFFNTNPLSGCAPLTVTFTNFSLGATTYTWNFGDGNVSNQFSTVHVYSSPGTYQVSMEAHNGCSYDTAYQTITVWPLPVAAFTLTQDTVCVGDLITVSNTSSSAISGLSWDFGDGSTSSLNPASHSYNQSGTYTISQILTTSLGCTDTAQKTVYVRQPPLINAGNDTLFCYQFVSAQLNPFASPLGGTWSGPGVTNASTGSFDPIAAGIGVHPVLYSYTDGFGCPNSDTVLVTITPPPTVEAGSDTTVCLNSVPFVLTGIGNPPGLPYYWSGTLIQPGGLVTPSQVGSFLMTFHYGSGTCAVEDYLSITVNPLPSINLTGNDSVFCLNNPVWNLIASPSGGIWSGPGVIGNTFDPASSGPGLFQLNYSYTDANGCTNNQSLTVRVNPLPTVFAGNDTTVCNQAISVQLSGNFSNQGVWSGPGVSINGNFTPPGVGVYQAVYTYEDALGCSNSDTIEITVVPPVFADAGPGLSACVDSGTFVLPGFTPSTGGFWTGPGIVNAATGQFNPAQALGSAQIVSTFALIYSYGTGNCYTADTTYVTVYPLPLVNAGSDQDACITEDSVLLSAVSPAAGVWSGPGIVDAGGTFIPTLAGVGTHTLTYSYTNPVTGCSNQDAILFTVHPQPVSAFGPLFEEGCQPLIVNFNNLSSGATGTIWNFGDGNISTAASPAHVFLDTGVFTVTLIQISSFGCSDTSTGTVVVHPKPLSRFTLLPDSACYSPANAYFTNLSSDPTGSFWTFGNGATSTLSDPVVTYAAPGSYTITLYTTNAFGCRDTSSDVFNVYPTPTAVFSSPDPSGCEDLDVSFTNSSLNGVFFQWDFGDGNTSQDPNPVNTYTNPGAYDVMLIVTGVGGCTATSRLEDYVQVLSSPTASFNYEASSNPTLYGALQFNNNSIGASAYQWDFGDGSSGSNLENPQHRYDNYGTYIVTLVATNVFGCTDTFELPVYVDYFKGLFIPNAFSPLTGPEGVRTFLPKGKGLRNYRLEIFDTWGIKLWESTLLDQGSPAEGWNGVYNGKVLQQDVYVWKIYAEFLDGTVWIGQRREGQYRTTGTVTLLR